MAETEESPPNAADSAEESLWRALRAGDAAERLALATDGLERAPADISPDTHLLLLRQIYLAHLELRELPAAIRVAQAMTTIGPMRDVAQHDLARILWIAERQEEAITAQRFAARAAPAERRSFHLWTLACFLFHAGAHEPALSALDRGLRWARRDRPLLMAQAALIRLEQDEPVEELERVLRELRESPHGRGYGQYLLGMIALYLGDDSKAVVYLRAFLTRHASADVPTQLTLRDELGAARAALARLDSD